MHVFTAFIFPSEQCGEIISSLLYYFAAFYYFASYHLFTTATHYKACIAVAMQWPIVFCCTDSIPRDCSHICGEALALRNLRWFVVTASELDQPSVTPLSVAG